MYSHIFVMNNCTQAEQGPAEWNKTFCLAYPSLTKRNDGGARGETAEEYAERTSRLGAESTGPIVSSATVSGGLIVVSVSAVAWQVQIQEAL